MVTPAFGSKVVHLNLDWPGFWSGDKRAPCGVKIGSTVIETPIASSTQDLERVTCLECQKYIRQLVREFQALFKSDGVTVKQQTKAITAVGELAKLNWKP